MKIYNDVKYRCVECRKEVSAIASFGLELRDGGTTVDLCADCLKAAIDALGEAINDPA